MSARALAVNLIAGFSGTGLKTAQEQIQGLGKSVNDLSSKVGKAALSFAAFKGAQIVGDFAAKAVTEARNLERNLAAVDTVFGNLSGTINQFSKDAVDVGLSQAEAAKASVFLGSVLKQSGFEMTEVAKETQNLVSLGADLALTYGYDVQEALLGMTALFRGEYDPIEKFGVAMKQSEINSELAARGFDKLEGSARRLAEQQIRLQFLYERSADSQGAFERQSGTLAVEQERLQASMNNMLQTAGGPLLTVMADLAEAMIPIVQDITPILVEQFEKLVPTGEELKSKLTELADTFVKFVDILGNLATVFINISSLVIQNIELISMFVVTIASMRLSTAIVMSVAAAFEVVNTKVQMTEVSVKKLKLALLGSGIGIAVVGIGSAFAYMAGEAEKAEKAVGVNYVTAESKMEDLVERIKVLRAQLADATKGFEDGAEEVPFYSAEIERLEKALADARLAMSRLNSSTLDDFAENVKTNSITAGMHLRDLMNNIAPYVAPPPAVDEEKTGEAAKDYVKIFTDNLADEMAKQRAKVQLIGKGASEGLIESILSTDNWMKVWVAIKSGDLSLKNLQNQFNKTSAGAEELKKRAEAAVSPLSKLLDRLKDDAAILKASEALVEMGYSADFVKEALADEEWQKIYDDLVKRTESGVARVNEIWASANPAELTDIFDISDFIAQLSEDARKEAARQVLLAKGASQDFAEAIIGSGDDWEALYKQIIDGAKGTVAELQAIFNTTRAGLDEMERKRAAAQAEYDKAYKDFLDKIEEANKALEDAFEKELRAHEKAMDAYERHIDLVADFRKEMDGLANLDVLNTYERAIGRFEGQSVKSFENIRKATESAFEKGLITSAYRDELFAYARTHEKLLNDIQRQRDELANKKSLVESLMSDVKSATAEAANITSLFAKIDETSKDVNVAKVIQDTVQSGKNLKDFRVTLITNLANPLNEVASKAKLLTSNFQSVVDRTRVFLENLRTLRKLGLDPMLFNQLVEAGVEAGGETAQALIDGGAETVREVNGLFGELNKLGAELAEETAQVMYGTGIEFTDSLMAGIQSKQDALEAQARAMATAFANAFTPIINAALAFSMPAVPIAPTPPTLFSPQNPPPGVIAPKPIDEAAKVVEQASRAASQASIALGNAKRAIEAILGSLRTSIGAATDDAQRQELRAREDIFQQIARSLSFLAPSNFAAFSQQIGLNDLSAGMSSKDLMARTGLVTTNNFTINVTTNNRAGGTSAAEAVVKALNDYVQTNGSVANIVTGVGQVAV